MKMFKTIPFFVIAILVGCITTPQYTKAQDISTFVLPWKTLDSGLFYCEIDAPEKSILNDSKLSILKVDPTKFDFNLLTATEFGQHPRTAPQWAEEFKMEVVVNLSMYQYNKGQTAKAYCINYNHINNSNFSGYYNALLAFHPVKQQDATFEIIDMTCRSWSDVKNDFYSFCQSMRMIDCNRMPMAWDKRPGQSCSMVVASTDIEGFIYFIFTRSPYTHPQMIGFLLNLPLQLTTTVYLEGGPETSLYIATPDTTISKFGCYVSKTYERDDNAEFWKIPNVIGIRKK